nr:unnamed protein product [Digitaria exilis]
MEMALRAQSPLCSRGRPLLVVRPVAAATGLAQPTIGHSRFTGRRLVRCMVSSSDYPKRNARRTSAPKPKGTASRGGYASRPTAESSAKKVGESSTDEGDLGKSNGTLHSEETELAGTAGESSDVNLPGNVSSSAAKDEAETKEEADQNQLSASSSTSMDDESIDRKLDEYRGKISALASSKPEPSTIASVRGQDKPVVGVHEQEKSITGSQEHGSSIVDEPPKGRPFAEAIVGYPVKDAEEELPVSEDVVDPEVLRRRLQELADENYSVGNKCFVFPEVVKADSMIDIYLNRKSDIDEDSFEDFLIEEKQKELERLAAEEAERKRQAEEERRREEERAAMEADRAQAKSEVEMKKEKLHQMLSSASRYSDNLWKDLSNLMKRMVIGVTLPERALVLDWVFADGPPGNATNYDNNGRQDFHAIIPNNIPEDMFWVEEEHKIFRRLQQERREREVADRLKAENSAKMKAEMKEKTMRAFLLSQKHIVYTEPLEVRAGNTVNVLYNPSNTVLNGKPEVWFRGSFNRWTHPSGPLPPQKMVKAENGSHLQATVRVPLDAYMMDFVFSESEDGGIYDNRNGMDYHIPVSDSIAKEPPMHIVHIAVEMAPIAKVGGLGDVVTSLSRAVQDLGHNVEVILPKMFWVGCVYGKNDESRFGFFCHSALEFLRQKGSSPDIIHCHDWSSAPVAWLYKEQYALNGLGNGRVVFTIHNLEFGAHHIGKAMAHCDKATTVSDTYSKEVAGHGAIAPHYFKFHGIRNGIDPDIWDPYTDVFIPVHYTSENVVEGKSAAKKALQQKLGLQQTDTPIVGIISRLTVQKGIHLIKHAIYRTLERNGQVVLLGSAPDPRIQGDFTNLASQLHGEYHGRVKLCLTYDEPLSHLIYAGADFILVPSIFEPCGLTQLIAMRYGSIPIVRKTGGLYDTVFDVDNDKDRALAQGLEPNGFNFEGADSSGVDYALDRQVAITTFYDARDWFNSLCKRVMEQDWSWNRPALDYMELYHSARKN